MTAHDPFAAAPPDLRELLALASDLALQAGRVHAEGRQEALRVETKSSPDRPRQPGGQGRRAPHRRPPA